MRTTPWTGDVNFTSRIRTDSICRCPATTPNLLIGSMSDDETSDEDCFDAGDTCNKSRHIIRIIELTHLLIPILAVRLQNLKRPALSTIFEV